MSLRSSECFSHCGRPSLRAAAATKVQAIQRGKMQREATQRLLQEDQPSNQGAQRGLAGGTSRDNDLMRRAVDGDKGGGYQGGGGFDGGGFGRDSRNSSGESGWNLLRLRNVVASAVSRPFALALDLPNRVSAARRSSVSADEEGGEERKSRRSFSQMCAAPPQLARIPPWRGEARRSVVTDQRRCPAPAVATTLPLPRQGAGGTPAPDAASCQAAQGQGQGASRRRDTAGRRERRVPSRASLTYPRIPLSRSHAPHTPFPYLFVGKSPRGPVGVPSPTGKAGSSRPPPVNTSRPRSPDAPKAKSPGSPNPIGAKPSDARAGARARV